MNPSPFFVRSNNLSIAESKGAVSDTGAWTGTDFDSMAARGTIGEVLHLMSTSPFLYERVLDWWGAFHDQMQFRSGGPDVDPYPAPEGVRLGRRCRGGVARRRR